MKKKTKTVGYSDPKFHAESKNYPKIWDNKKARQTLKIFGRAISSHLVSFLFLTCQEKYLGRVEAENLSVTKEKNSCDYLKR